MAAETKRPAKVPVALPRSESDSTPTTIPRDAVYKAVIGARSDNHEEEKYSGAFLTTSQDTSHDIES